MKNKIRKLQKCKSKSKSFCLRRLSPRWILLPSAQSEARVESLSCPSWPRPPPGSRTEISTRPTRSPPAGHPRLERGERQRRPRLLQNFVSESSAGPSQTRRLLFHLLVFLWFRGGRLLPGEAHPSAPPATKTVAWGGERQRRRAGEGGAAGAGTEGQHTPEKSSESECKGQRQELCHFLMTNRGQQAS